MSSNTNSLEEEIDCKGCKRTFKKTSILIHIHHHKNKDCKNFYTQSELLVLKSEARSRQKLAIKSWRETNAEKISEQNQEWYNKNSDTYNAYRKKKYMEENMKLKNAKKYKEKKKEEKVHEDELWIERLKDNIERSILNCEKWTRMDVKLDFDISEKKEIDRLLVIDISEDLLEKTKNLKSIALEKTILYESKIADMGKEVKLLLGPREDWKFEEPTMYINDDFIYAMYEIVKRYIADDHQLFHFHVHDILKDFAEKIGQSVSYEIKAPKYKQRCMESLQQYDQLKADIIEKFKNKSVSRIRFDTTTHHPTDLMPLQLVTVPLDSNTIKSSKFVKKQ